MPLALFRVDMYSSSSSLSSPFLFHGGGPSVASPSRAPSPDSPAALRPPTHSAQPSQHSYPTSASPLAAQLYHRSALPLLPPLAASAFGPSLAAVASQPSVSSSAASVDFSSDATRPLRARIEQLERENAELRRSVLEMGVAYNRALVEVKERWKAAVRAAGTAGEAALTELDGVGVIKLSQTSTAVMAAGEGKEKEKDRRERVAGERKERERHRSASPALFAERQKLTANGISVSVADEDEEEEMQIERVFSSCSSASSHSQHHPNHPHLQQSGPSASSTSPSRLFSKRLDLLGHSGAVYALSFSGDGRLMASAGMDKTIQLWDMHAILSFTSANAASASPTPTTAASSRYQLLSLSAHTLNISSLAFALTSSSCSSSSASPSSSLSSSHLISASFDKTVAFHDLSTGTTVRSVDVGSFATSLAPSSLSGGQICYVGTTGKRLLTLDRRAGSIVASWDNDTMVSAVSIYRDCSTEADGGGGDEKIVTGDHGGLIRTWSSRMQRRLRSQPNDPHNKPISHLHCLPTASTALPHRSVHEQMDDDDDDASDRRTLIATNSFDDVLRVYYTGRDRAASSKAAVGGGAAAVNGETDEFQLLYELKGVKNQNWPIKSSFYRGKEWHDRQQWMELHDPLSSSSSGSSSSSPPSSPSSPHSHSSLSSDDEKSERGSSAPAATSSGRVVDVTSQYRPRQRQPSSATATVPFSLPHSRLLASGSADGCVYVFDVTAGGGSGRAAEASASCVESESRLLQRLEGHRDRVYTCTFHPVEPVLLSAGADAVVKVWTAGKV